MSVAFYEASKRVADIVGAATVLLVSLPVWIWAFLAISLTDGWPFLYAQRRVGQGGRLFWIYKFRSMIKDAERNGIPAYSPRGDPRVTRVGRLMRKTALDEIPQLLSILRGDMSWVGPRPARPQEVAQYILEIPGYGLRHRVRPGLTGYAQVYLSDYSDISKKLAYDSYYIQHRGLWMDLTLYVRSWANTLLGRWERARQVALSEEHSASSRR